MEKQLQELQALAEVIRTRLEQNPNDLPPTVRSADISHDRYSAGARVCDNLTIGMDDAELITFNWVVNVIIIPMNITAEKLAEIISASKM